MELPVPQIFEDEPEHEPEEDEPEDAPEEDEPEHEPEPRVLPEISKGDWNRMFEKGKFKKEDMDTMVMSYLLDKELPQVAEAFHRESGYPFDSSCSNFFSLIGTQKIVRDLIINLQFDDAIHTLNQKMTPVFLQIQPRLHFYLDQQKMIELCRNGDINEALNSSREFVKWESFESEYETDFSFEKECKRTLLLMLYGDNKESPVSDLLDYRRATLIASFVVTGMIYAQNRIPGNHIDTALKMLELEEEKLKKVVKFPNFNKDSGYPELN